MFYHDNQLQYEVEVEEPDPEFGRMLQQAIGGVEGEMRVAMQYFFQAAAIPDEHAEYREMLRDTAAEELGHIEMLAAAVNKNLRGASASLGDGDSAVSELLPRQFLSSGMHAMPTDANGAAFDGSWIVASGNLAADMYANIMAESTGRLLATRLYELADDPGMKDMLAYLIARDTMHQNQWITLLKELGDPEEVFDVHPIPDSFPDEVENQEFSYAFMSTNVEPQEATDLPWTTGSSIDEEGEYSFLRELDLDGAPMSVPKPSAQAYNEPAPQGED
ncbi:manganese catalase family protein [Halobacterium jilantaiense]|uniref:Mn-containing catalase n=1 Tax=Halobacterium jilantaiense TaxID=355548 RepID=A0A1I0N1T3_9EURY|nr:manganese catalase family protein [Halobacterium jilantaiense]SEV95004.1 Mn-containing catalase [Halobacterium jilantaiense]